MPNWVTSKLTITGPNSTEIMKSLLIENKEEDSDSKLQFDFNKIIPMPPELNIVSGSITDHCIDIYLTYLNPYNDAIKKEDAKLKVFENAKVLANRNKGIMRYSGECTKKMISQIIDSHKREGFDKLEDFIEYGRKAVENIMNHNAVSWYDWCNENWGTKWNACHNIYLEEHPNEICFDTAWGNVSTMMKRKDFPLLKVGKRNIVNIASFVEWQIRQTYKEV